jgi:CTP synthase
MKFVLVTGGVVSGIGKGITASSIGLLLRSSGLRVTSIKIDPYLNKDAGTMSPYEHGEVFVLNDGGEADLDLGNYERFMGLRLTSEHNITTGKIYDLVISKERRGDYLGKTVQVVPHITDAIQSWIERVSTIPVDGGDEPPEVCIIELGGTVGDIESMVFLEALRQFEYRVGRDNFCHILVSLVPFLSEQKSKPTQHSVRELRATGLSPDLIVCRGTSPLDKAITSKIALFCMVPVENVISVHDVHSIYHVPLVLLSQRVPELIFQSLRLPARPGVISRDWIHLTQTVEKSDKRSVSIALVGKYTGLKDSYLSVIKAVHHSALALDLEDEIIWIDAVKLEHNDREEFERLKKCDGILIPGGFGSRGVEGKILACTYARESKKPFLGICLGLQVAVIEFARNCCGITEANSEEFVEGSSENNVVVFMPEIKPGVFGGTMRLGIRQTKVRSETLASRLYGGKTAIYERHRHRYEVNPRMIDLLEKSGDLVFSGKDERKERMEILEMPRHPFFIAVQFHPEFQSRPMNPSPPFLGLVAASAGLDLQSPEVVKLLNNDNAISLIAPKPRRESY